MDFSLWQIAIVLVIALLVFGPRRLPELGRSLGAGMREFKDSITGKGHEEEKRQPAELERSESEGEQQDEEQPVEGEVVGRNRA